MSSPIKCACPKCNCLTTPSKGYVHDGKVYCSRTCAHECTAQTCVCIHERCDQRT